LKFPEKQTIALGGSSISCFLFLRPGISPIAIIPDKVEIYTKNEGVKRILPPCCFPLWEERGSFSRLLLRINE